MFSISRIQAIDPAAVVSVNANKFKTPKIITETQLRKPVLQNLKDSLAGKSTSCKKGMGDGSYQVCARYGLRAVPEWLEQPDGTLGAFLKASSEEKANEYLEQFIAFIEEGGLDAELTKLRAAVSEEKRKGAATRFGAIQG